jgi:hypothetical protein
MLVPKKTFPRHNLGFTIPALLVLALGFAVLSTGCKPVVESQDETIEATARSFTPEWPARDPTVVQACMDLDPAELASSLPAEYLNNPTYCETHSDCYCQSGSGVPFVGCANAYHARISFGGCYACSECVCVDNHCQLQ